MLSCPARQFRRSRCGACAVVLCTVLLSAVSASPAGAQPPAAPTPGAASLHSLLWLGGQWRSEEGDQLSEETWSAPHGSSMIGMWRLVEKGVPRVIELLSLSVEGGDVVLRLRHFDARLVAREEKGAPVALKQVEAGEKMAVFQGEATQGPLTITYRVEGDELVGTVKHGTRPPETYRMRRVRYGLTGGVAK